MSRFCQTEKTDNVITLAGITARAVDMIDENVIMLSISQLVSEIADEA